MQYDKIIQSIFFFLNQNQVIEALDIALNAIDIEKSSADTNLHGLATDRIYEDIDDLNEPVAMKEPAKPDIIPKPLTQKRNQIPMPMAADVEPYYQVPKRANESYYEVPKSCPIPVYENVDMYYDNTASTEKFAASHVPIALGNNKQALEPPKEKPPPPPEDSTDDERGNDADLDPQDAMKRMNSTKRIKKEIRNKRSSFLGIDGGEDDSFLELTVAPPPDMAAFIQEERRLERQMYIKAGLYDSSDTGDSRDSGVSENHSRQSSEPLTTSSEEHDQDHPSNGDAEHPPVNGNRDWLYSDNYQPETDPILKHLDERERMKCLEDDLQEKEEVLKVERELLQLEQEELKRQRSNVALRKSYEQLDEHSEMHHGSTQDINGTNNLYANMPHRYDFYQVQTNYRKSMPNLQAMNPYESDDQMALPPIPPAKPLRVQEYLRYGHKLNGGNGIGASMDAVNGGNMPASMHLKQQSHYHSQSTEDFVPLRQPSATANGNAANGYANMSRHTLHALSAVPKPKLQDAWVQQRNHENDLRHNDYVNSDAFAHQTNGKARFSESRLSGLQPLKRNSDSHGFNYNNHWLIQEAEQRRIDQQRSTARPPVMPSNNFIQRRGSNDNKPLPDAVIQTLTQRVQSRLVGDKKRYDS